MRALTHGISRPVFCRPGQTLLLLILGIARAQGSSFVEDFAADPAVHGWKYYGDASLFRWDSASQNLQVTWNSAQTNSYLFRSLEVPVTKKDDFQLSFDLTLNDVTVGLDSEHPFTFEVAIGLLAWQTATNSAFLRGVGTAGPTANLVEFDYFPDSGFGATISPTIVSSNRIFATSFTFPVAMKTGNLYGISMNYAATNQTLIVAMTENGQPFSPIKPVTLAATFTDFMVDTLAIESYSHQGADGSIRAHGVIDNIHLQLPDPPISAFVGNRDGDQWNITFTGVVGWTYSIEKSQNLSDWTAAAAPITGTGLPQQWQETMSSGTAFYRIRAQRP